MATYTPHARSTGRKKNIGLSAKEYTKIAGTIASVRRSRADKEEEETKEASAFISCLNITSPLTAL